MPPSEGQRQFKLSSEFKDWFKGQGGKLIRSDKSDLVGLSGRFQGVDLWKLGDLGYKAGRSLYKLALRDNWAQTEEGDRYKNVLGLVKVSWEKDGSKKGRREIVNSKITEITVNDSNKVWQIMAQGQNNIYLMPVVRATNWCGSGDWDVQKEVEKWIGENGVKDIKSWGFDKNSEWKAWNSEQNERLKKAMESGFSITRTIENAVWSWSGGGADYGAIDSVKTIKQRKNSEAVLKGKNTRFLGKNAGRLRFGGIMSEAILSCNRGEAYFPLDLVILGESEETKNPKVTYENNGQKITIDDSISEVIGVN